MLVVLRLQYPATVFGYIIKYVAHLSADGVLVGLKLHYSAIVLGYTFACAAHLCAGGERVYTLLRQFGNIFQLHNPLRSTPLRWWSTGCSSAAGRWAVGGALDAQTARLTPV